MKKVITTILIALLVIAACSTKILFTKSNQDNSLSEVISNDGLIKWVDFNCTYEAMCTAYKLDIESYESEHPLKFVDMLSYAATKSGGSFKSNSVKYINEYAKLRQEGKTHEEITEKLKNYSYYSEAYGAVLGGMVGEYEMENDKGEYEKKYGMKEFSPIGKGFSYSDYDDFGVSRSFGYRRQHLGHDMMGLIGTPIIAVESGYVEALGWNKYGGWRIGIRSHDKRRYYFYAHLRQNRPYSEGLKEGDNVTAGDVIGYMGHTGYSDKENVNNIDQVHLHFGLQLVFDESQKECDSEIWVDCYALCKFLAKNRSEIVKNEETKEWRRVKGMKVE